jgi:hypothetical protein
LDFGEIGWIFNFNFQISAKKNLLASSVHAFPTPFVEKSSKLEKMPVKQHFQQKKSDALVGRV